VVCLAPASFPWPAEGTPVVFLPVDEATETAVGLSQSNKFEVAAVCAAVATLLKSGARPTDVGVITFYAAQARMRVYII